MGVRLALAVLLLCAARLDARPTNMQEASQSYGKKFMLGAFAGYQTVLDLMGYYDQPEGSWLGGDGKVHTDDAETDEEWESYKTTVQVVGIGLGRTGSTSLALALKHLGYSPFHDDEQSAEKDLLAMSDDEQSEEKDLLAMSAEDRWHVKLGDYGYNASFKTHYMWVAQHPEVKAILTVRDTPDKFAESWLVAATFYDLVVSRPFRWFKHSQLLADDLELEYKGETTGGHPEDYLNKGRLMSNYLAYNQKVQDAVPADRLLVFNVKQGWAPLCEFLGKPVPSIKFPHVHDRAKLTGEQMVVQLVTWIWPLACIIPAVLAWLAFSHRTTVPKPGMVVVRRLQQRVRYLFR